ncbi:MAG: hypothetical protein AB7H97_16230 [Pseudobdellovibrionaceae bacterium]
METIDNLGRVEFIKNVTAALGLTNEKIEYAKLNTIVVGGDEEGRDYKGGYFIFEAELSFINSAGTFQLFKCHQFLTVGNFKTLYPRLGGPVECKSL